MQEGNVPIHSGGDYGERVSDPKDALLAAAERLVAAHGPDGVSMRDVAKQAGQRNNSAVAYHFGNREGLLRALFERRMTVINVRRAELFGLWRERGDGDLRGLVEVVLRPLAEHISAAGPGSTYAQFMVRTLPMFEQGQGEGLPASALHREVGTELLARVAQPGSATAQRRLSLALTMATSALAMHEERIAARDGWIEDLDELLGDLVDMTVGALLVGPA